MDNEFLYDIALSFAGEDREYVEKVALELRRRKFNKQNVKVFYDTNEQHNLWGNDLYQKLANVYQKQARFVVVFISHNYAIKEWPKHELRSAQARALFEDSPYILPARFDDTEIPGLHPTIGYIDLRALTIKEFVDLIMNKLKSKPDVSPKPAIKKSKITIFRNPPAEGLFRHEELKVYCDEKLVGKIKRFDKSFSFEVSHGLHAIQVYLISEETTDGRGITRRSSGKSEKHISYYSNEEHYFACNTSVSIADIFTAMFNPYSNSQVLLYVIKEPIKQ